MNYSIGGILSLSFFFLYLFFLFHLLPSITLLMTFSPSSFGNVSILHHKLNKNRLFHNNQINWINLRKWKLYPLANQIPTQHTSLADKCVGLFWVYSMRKPKNWTNSINVMAMVQIFLLTFIKSFNMLWMRLSVMISWHAPKCMAICKNVRRFSP